MCLHTAVEHLLENIAIKVYTESIDGHTLIHMRLLTNKINLSNFYLHASAVAVAIVGLQQYAVVIVRVLCSLQQADAGQEVAYRQELDDAYSRCDNSSLSRVGRDTSSCFDAPSFKLGLDVHMRVCVLLGAYL